MTSEYTRVHFTTEEEAFLRSRDTCRIATVGNDGWPHCVPVGYVHKDEFFYVPANKRSRKVSNLRTNNRVCIVVDDEPTETGLMIRGYAEIAEAERFIEIKKWMEPQTGWTIGEYSTGAILVIKPICKVRWKLK